VNAPAATHPQRRPWPRRAARYLTRFSIITLIGVPLLVGLAAAAAFGMLLYTNLPGRFPKPRPPKQAQPSTVYDADGNVIGTFRKFDISVPMTQKDIPQDLKDAVVANEDRKFWTNNGVDPEGMARAALADYTSGKVKQGGSTITQQYIRAVYLNDDKTLERKLNEAVLATRFERDLVKQYGSQHAAKEQILFRYLNTTYFGDGAYGAAAAAESYFQTDISHLTISEAATLASIIPSPSKYGPREDLFGADARRIQVLGEMKDQGMINQTQYDQAKSEFLWPVGLGDPGKPTTPVYPLPVNGPSKYPYFVDYVREYMAAKLGSDTPLYTDGLQIHTTIDPNLQGAADLTEQKYAANAPINTEYDPDPAHPGKTIAKPDPVDMAIVSVDPSTGYIKAMTGGRNYQALQLNLAVDGLGKQPGSSFKAFTIATALEEGFTPDKTYDTQAAYFPTGCHQDSCAIHNSEGSAEGVVNMVTATAASINTYFAPLAHDVGPNNIAAMATRLGVHIVVPNANPPGYDERITVGYKEVTPLSMASAYGVFDNHGVRVPATPIVKAVKADGTVVIDNTKPQGTQVLNPAIAETVTQLLKGPITNGTATKNLGNFGRPAAGKTGTTNNEADAWFVGYTPQLATAVWMGHDGAILPLRGVDGVAQVFGGDIPAKAWGDFMHLATANLPPLDFPVPGPLPPPNVSADSNVAPDPLTRRANTFTIPQLSTDCDGPCSQSTTLTAPPPPPPPPTTAPATTTTQQNGPSP
jgi:penicillin-binding protein 1A